MNPFFSVSLYFTFHAKVCVACDWYTTFLLCFVAFTKRTHALQRKDFLLRRWANHGIAMSASRAHDCKIFRVLARVRFQKIRFKIKTNSLIIKLITFDSVFKSPL